MKNIILALLLGSYSGLISAWDASTAPGDEQSVPTLRTITAKNVTNVPELFSYDFEGTKIPVGWKATKSKLKLSKEHYKKGTQSLCWNAADKATLELAFGEKLTVGEQNAANFHVYSMNATNDTVYVEFLDAGNKVLKKATLLVNFKGWREFNRPYTEYKNKEVATIDKLRFTYKANSGSGQNIFFDDMNFNSVADSKHSYPDMMVLDIDYLSPKKTRLLYLYSLGTHVVSEGATEAEIADFKVLKKTFSRKAVGGSDSEIEELIKRVDAMNIVRNSDGTVSGNPMPSAKDLTLEYIGQLSTAVEVLSASSDSRAKTAFNNLVDYILDQGVLYQCGGMVWYGEQQRIPSRFLNAMNEYTDEQKKEMIKAVKWMIEFNAVYAPIERMYYISSDYIYLNLPSMYGCAVNYPDQNTAIESVKALTRMLKKRSEYSPGTADILKPDGTGFHHGTHYNGYMYAYKTWVEHLGYLKGTCFRIDRESYERIKKAVISMYIMATRSEDGTSNLYANSLAGRHPLVGGTELSFLKSLFTTLIEVGGDIMNTGIDSELASQYNYFFMTDFYKGVDKIDMDGFYQFNYSPSGVYRRNNWVATMRCPTTRFWGGELYSKTNRFGRYQAHGTLEIMYDGTLQNSGLPKKDNDNGTKETGGWDWNVEPGATTVHYTSWQEMMPNRDLTSRFDQFSKTTNFAGALSWGDCGMFGAEFDQGDSWGSQRFTPTNLTFKKSVYAFDGMLISLGSNISTFGAYGDDMITATNLFQGIDSEASSDLIVNGKVMSAGSDPKTNDSSSDLWMVTPQGTGYFVPKGNDPVIIKHGRQSSPNETGANLNHPVTVTAAKAYINHGIKTSDKKYVFVAIPATNAKDMAQWAVKLGDDGGDIYEIKAQNEKLHVLTYKPAHITAYSIFTAAGNLNYGYVKSTASEMLLMEKYDAGKRMLSLAICNPNLRPMNDETYGRIFTPTTTNIIVEGTWRLEQNVEGVILTVQADKTTKIDLTLKDGAPVYLNLIDIDGNSHVLTGKSN